MEKEIANVMIRNPRAISESRLIVRSVAAKGAKIFMVGVMVAGAIVGICDIVPTFKNAFRNN